ncbi:chemotaxis protein CheW [Pseudorhodoplanes sp.]|uniref:chemotaxis protein CheW n=1 Tax=Pseudorhodoplanes sp. TaxID=1934341 RepID=UPI002C7D1B0B|nr:chemotaxis protein CheW [Pseudorhodoplanes sp.]HWV52692.1 chemotaxis protein CheW [Pseudorhodoplanes sp.]
MTSSNQLSPEYVTVMIGAQLFGLPIARVQDVFVLSQMTRVPLAPDDIAGVINLRGRIVTAIDLRRRLGVSGETQRAQMAVGIESGGESYGLVIDAVGEVMKLSSETAEPVPVNLDERLKLVASGVHRLDDGLLVVLDVDRLLDLKISELAA